MKFLQIIEGLKVGKKFRRPGWHSFIFVTCSASRICDQELHDFRFEIEDFEADDWMEC